MKYLPSTFRLAVFACIASCLLCFGYGLDLYETNFDAFPTGQGTWVGTENWATTGASTDAFGISDNALPTVGNAAYIGFNQPANTLSAIFRPFDFAPVASGHPIIRIETIIGVQDSTNGRRDQFFLNIRNRAGAFLAGIGFDNRATTDDATNPFIRLDGAGQFGTLENFDRNVLHILFIEIDFAANTWSAELDGLFPIFTDVPFSNSGNDLDLGFISYEWQLSASSTAAYGDNFLLVADILVQAIPVGTTPFLLEMRPNSATRQTLSWLTEPGFQYEIEYAPEAGGDFLTLPGSLVSNIDSPSTFQFVDSPPANENGRVYRVQRSVQP